MLSLNQPFRELLECFNSAGVRYLVLGGYAVNYYGYHRNTKDIDLWIAVDPVNAERVSLAMQQFGFSASAVAPKRFLARGLVHAFGREPFRVDILTEPSGVDFEACFPKRIEVSLEGVRVPIIALEDLKANKRASGRQKDLADLEGLPPPAAPERPKAKEKPKTRGRSDGRQKPKG